MKKKFLYLTTFLLLVGISIINLTIVDNHNFNSNLELSSVLKIAMADSELPCSHATAYFNDDMVPCFSKIPCYSPSGGGYICGYQRCCEPGRTDVSCTETECDEDV